MRILVIDDDLGYGPMACEALRRNGFESHFVSSGEQGLSRVKALKPDLILLDIHMPRIDGIVLYRALSHSLLTCSIPIILITGEPLLDSLLEAVTRDLHAEPILLKRDGIDVMLGRVRRTLSHSGRILSKGQISADPISREVRVGMRRIPRLPAKRFDLLCALIRRRGPVDRDELLEAVWPGHIDTKVIDMTIARLRQDLHPVKGLQIATVRHGYELVIDDAGGAIPSGCSPPRTERSSRTSPKDRVR
ncbi:MAG: response regulator transcription factor [Elusimicrobia bacterium]|nr:response regulator transcription factor [Elusimicrobiota bacterium]